MKPVSFRYGYSPEQGWTAECADSVLRSDLEAVFAHRFPLKAWPEEMPVVGHFELPGAWGVAFKPAGRLEVAGVAIPATEYRSRGFDPFAVAGEYLEEKPEFVEVPPPSGPLPEHLAVPELVDYLPYAHSLFQTVRPSGREITYWSLLPHGLSPRYSPLSRFAAGARVQLKLEELRAVFAESPLGSPEVPLPQVSLETELWKDPSEPSPRAPAEAKRLGRRLREAMSEMQDLTLRLTRLEAHQKERALARSSMATEASRRFQQIGERLRQLERTRALEAQLDRVPVAHSKRPGSVRGAVLAAALLGGLVTLGWWLYQRGEQAGAELGKLADRVQAAEKRLEERGRETGEPTDLWKKEMVSMSKQIGSLREKDEEFLRRLGGIRDEARKLEKRFESFESRGGNSRSNSSRSSDPESAGEAPERGSFSEPRENEPTGGERETKIQAAVQRDEREQQ